MSNANRDDPSAAAEVPSASDPARPGPELRLIDRKAFVGLGAFEVAPGIRVADLSLQIPNVTFPFNVSGGASRYQKQRCLFGQLDLEIAPARVTALEAPVLAQAPELARLRLHLRAGFIEAEGALRSSGAEPVPFTCRIAFDGAGDGVAARAFDVRLYAPSALPAPLIGQVMARAALRAQVVPGLSPRGLGAAAASPLGELLRRTVPQRGFRLPDMSAARLGSALVSPGGITLRFSAGAPPPGGLADEELLLAIEGAHAFDEGEKLLEAGQLDEARTFFLRAGELAQAHPFATDRLCALLLGDADVADYALDLVRAFHARRPLAAAPLWMEAVLRLARGEPVLAAQRYLELAALARGRGEEASAFWSAQAAARVAGAVSSEDPSKNRRRFGAAPGEPSAVSSAQSDFSTSSDSKAASLAVRALHESLGLRPDHLPSLVALAEQAERAGDDAAALRAYRRLTAVAREPSQAARAHVRLGELCARVERDLAGARLHYDAALRLEPDDAAALLGLAELCARSDEPLRALRALDRVRALHPQDAQLAGRAELQAGAVYERALGQLENARLRYAEAARALAGSPEPWVHLGRVSERLGRVPEAVEALTQALELAGDAATPAAHEAQLLLARVAEVRLHDPARQRAHLEAAVRIRPDDAEAWEALIPLLRADEAHAPLAEALARAAPRAPEVRGRVAMLVESAELLRLRLSRPDLARPRYQQALALEPRSRAALEGILALDELDGDMGAACEHLRLLLDLSPPGPGRLPLLRRLAAAARDGKKDLDLAARATQELLALAPDDLPSLAELVTLQRRRGDLPALALALEAWARGCERSGDAASTAVGLRELASLYDARLGRRDEALSALEKAHALAPHDPAVLGELADLALRAGRHRLARHAIRALLALLPAEGAPSAPPAQRRADLHERLARAAEAVGDLSEATGALEEAYRLVAEDAVAERLDGLYALARRDEARMALARRRGAALARAGKGAQAAGVLAQSAALARAGGDHPAAMRDFTAALAADPTGALALPALDALAELAVSAGQPGEAAGHLAKRAALTASPREAAQLLLRGARLCFGVDEPRALSLLTQAATRDGRLATARAALAERLAKAGEWGKAWREAEAALEVGPQDPDVLDPAAQGSLERSAARWAEKAGEPAAAARLWGAYLARQPDDLDALQARVALLRHLGDPAALAAALEQLEARTAGEAALAVARELGHLYELELGRIDVAAQVHRRILLASADDRPALTALARLLIGPSEVDERVAVLARLAGMAPSGEAAAALHVERGEALAGALRFADAAQAFADAARLAPDPAPALGQVIAAAEEAGLADLALSARRSRAELAARRGEPGAAEALLDVAERFCAAEAWDDARRCLAQVLELVPGPESASNNRRRLGAAPPPSAASEDPGAASSAESDFSTGIEWACAAHAALARVGRACGDVRAVFESLRALAALTTGAARLDALVGAAEAARSLGDLPAARDALLGALAQSPRDPALARSLAELQRQLGDAEGEVESLGLLARLEVDPQAAAEHWLRAATLLRDGGAPGRAEAALRQALALQPGRAAVRAPLVELVLARGEHAEAAALLEAGARHEADSAASARTLLRAASLHEGPLASREDALRTTRMAFARAPELPEVIAALADRSYLAGAASEAAPLLARTLELSDRGELSADDADSERWVSRALALAELRTEQGQPALAAAVLEKAAALAPWRADVARALHAAERVRDPRAALARLTRALAAMHPGQATHGLLLEASAAAQAQDEPSLAAKLLEDALPTAPDRAPIEARLIALYLATDHVPGAVALLRARAERARARGDQPAALEALAQAAPLVESAPGGASEAAALWAMVAALHIACGQPVEAAAALVRRAAIARDVLGQLDEAESDLRRAIDLHPGDLSSVRLAQDLCRARGDASGEAEWVRVELERLDDAADRSRALHHLAELQSGPLEDPAGALESLRAALALDPHFDDARTRYEALLRASGQSALLAHSLVARAGEAGPGPAVAYLREAAHLFTGAAQLDHAADALEQARALAPADDGLALAAALAFASAGRDDEAALIDAGLLARDPALEPSFSRELARREAAGDLRGQASLFQARALAEPTHLASPRFLEAAGRFDAAGDAEAARRCELWAFERAPADLAAFERVVARHAEPAQRRVLDGVLQRRAQAVEHEAGGLHLRRARLLAAHGDRAEACAALDDALARGDGDPAYLEALVDRADLEAQLHGAAAAARFDESLAARGGLAPAERMRVIARLADTRAASGRDADAAALWEDALEGAAPEQARALFGKLGAAYARLGDPARQAEVLLRQADADPDDRVALLRAAAALAEGGPMARRALTALAEADRSPDSLLELARLELADGDPLGRARLVDAARAALVPSVSADLLLEASALFDDAAEREAARALRAEAHAADPDHLGALRAVAADLREADDAEALAGVLGVLVAREPDPAAQLALRREQVDLLISVDPAAARGRLLAWAQATAGDAQREPWARLEALARASGEAADLALALEQQAALEPDRAEPRWLEAAELHRAAGDLGRARAALAHAADAQGASVIPLQRRVALAQAGDDPLELATALEALAARCEGAERADGLHRASQAWTLSGRAEASLRALGAAVALAPDRADWQLALAEAALAQGQTELAQGALFAAAERGAAEERAALLARASELAEARGDVAAARAGWAACWALDPTDLAFERLSALLAAQDDRPALAALWAERAPATGAGDDFAASARAWRAAGDPARALEAWKRALDARPDDPSIAAALDEAAAEAGDLDARVQALTVQVERAPSAAQQARVLDGLAEVHQARGDAAASLAALRQAHAVEPGVAARSARLVDALEAAGAFAEAALHLGALPGVSAPNLLREAALHARAHQPREAGEALVRAVELAPADAEAPAALRALLPTLEPRDRAAVLARWAAVVPRAQQAALYVELAELAPGEGRRAALERAVDADPAAAEPFALLRVLLTERDDDRALAELLERRAEAVGDPAERGQLLMELGELYEGSLGELPQAFEAYERSLRAHPQNPGVQRDLAELAFELGRDARAAELYQALLHGAGASLRPRVLERLTALAIRGGDALGAVAHLEARLQLEPELALRRALLQQARTSGDPQALGRALAGLAGDPRAEVPERTSALAELTAHARQQGRAAQALGHAVAWAELAPEAVDAWRAVRELATAQADAARQLEAATWLAELEPSDHERAMMGLERARLLAERGEHAEAARAALAAHALTPRDELALRTALSLSERAGLNQEATQAALALFDLAGPDAVLPQASALAQVLVARGDAADALALLARAREGAPDDRALAEQVADVAERAGDLDQAFELWRELALQDDDPTAAAKLRALALRAERDFDDLARAVELADEAFALAPADEVELTAQAGRLEQLHRAREAAVLRAELALRAPGDAPRWAALAQAARAAQVDSLVRAAEALGAFQRGALPEHPSDVALPDAVRAELLAKVSADWQQALVSSAAGQWGLLPAPAASLRPGGPVLVKRIQALALALGVAAPSVRMDAGANTVTFGGPDALVVGIGLFSLPARVQDFVLALALARASLALPFAGGADDAQRDALARAHGLAAPPSTDALEAAAAALAAAAIDDPLSALVACTALDPAFAQADPRAWDRAAALQGPALRGAAAALAATLARLRAE